MYCFNTVILLLLVNSSDCIQFWKSWTYKVKPLIRGQLYARTKMSPYMFFAVYPHLGDVKRMKQISYKQVSPEYRFYCSYNNAPSSCQHMLVANSFVHTCIYTLYIAVMCMNIIWYYGSLVILLSICAINIAFYNLLIDLMHKLCFKSTQDWICEGVKFITLGYIIVGDMYVVMVT